MFPSFLGGKRIVCFVYTPCVNNKGQGYSAITTRWGVKKAEKRGNHKPRQLAGPHNVVIECILRNMDESTAPEIGPQILVYSVF